MTDGFPRVEGRRFHLVEVLGSGAFGTVYLAEQEGGAGFRRRVALKLLNREVAGMKEAGRRMRDEARILGRLAHRNIVAVLDLVRLGEQWAIVMDYVPGADLEHVVQAMAQRRAGVPGPAALEITIAVLRALHAALTAEDTTGQPLGVIHRDIKPSNIRLTEDGEVKVLDFGVARFSLDTRESRTRDTGWMGTERYMSPERILAEGDSSAGDVYAAGATLVEALVGRPLGRTPVLPDRHAPFVEESLDAVTDRLGGPGPETGRIVAWIRSMLAADPTKRPTAQAAADGLEALSREIPGESLPQFCRRFLPPLREQLVPTPAQGVLSERTRSLLASAGSFPFPPASTRTPQPPPPHGPIRMLLVGAAGIALFSGVVGIGAIGLAAYLYALGSDTIPDSRSPPPTESVAIAPAPPTESLVPPDEPVAIAPAPPTASPGPPDEPIVLAIRPTPQHRPAPRSAAGRPAPVPPIEPPPSDILVEKVHIVCQDASSMRVTCGDVSQSGTSSVRVTRFPAGTCAVTVDWLGRVYTAEVTVEHPGTVSCTVDGGSLTCR